MIGTWRILYTLLREAEYHGYGKGGAPKPPKPKSALEYRNEIFAYVTQRYGEHASEELQRKMKTLPFKEFKREVALEYFDAKLDGLIDSMVKQAIIAHRAQQSPPEEKPGKTIGPSGRTFVDPDDAEERQAKIDVMRQARSAPTGGQSAAQALMTPGKGGRHAVGSAGQHQPKTQPSVAAGIRPQVSADDRKKIHVSRSGLVKAQRDVDKETREKGVAAGVKLAKELGVPTTAERTTEHPDTGEKRIQIWSPDRVFKHMDVDRTPGGPGGKTDAERKAQAHRASQFAQAGQIDPDRLEKIKRGTLRRNAAPTQLGPNRPPSFNGERWKPHGREEEVPMSRPDPATGNWVRGKRVMNPKDTGAEVVGLDGKWVTPSVYASNMAQRKARGLPPEPSQDFGDEKTQSDFGADDEKTDPDAPAFPEDTED